MITQEELQGLVAASNEILSKVKSEYPDLKPHLVFGSRHGQAPVDSGVEQILIEFPGMCHETAEQKEAVRLSRAIGKLKREARLTRVQEQELGRHEEKLDSLLPGITFRDDVQVEFRFDQLKFEHIWALQKHPFVDQVLTSQSRASIRVVLGTLRSLTQESAVAG